MKKRLGRTLVIAADKLFGARVRVVAAVDGLIGIPSTSSGQALRPRKPGRCAYRLAPVRMTSLMLVMLFGLAGSGWIHAHSGTPKEVAAIEQSLIATETSLIEAKKKDDGAFFKRTVSDDFSLVGVDGQLSQGQEAIDNLGNSDLVELTPYNMKVVPAGDGGAIVTYDAIVREAPQEDQGPPPRYQHFSSLWVKHGGAWKLKFQQATAAHWGDW